MMFKIILLSICIHFIDSVSVRKGDDITTVEFKNDERPITENFTPSLPIPAKKEIDLLRQTVRDLSVELQTLEDTHEKEKTDPVMFYAVIRNKAFTYNVDTIIVFETIIVNDGSHYNNLDGVFVAPQKGTYLFAWTVTGSGSNFIMTELVVENNIIIGTGERSNNGGHPSGAMTSLCKMEKGDHAWIRTTGSNAGHYLYSSDNYPQSGFLGHLVLKE
ncbi:heavy metal-binding protein HIP-like [Mytilus edulis]|uniref:heavy metal-binding protein HIP-like n=1 Tax=Mytilus edulis TaxID=6550 RepID=UPI0039EDFBC3